MYFERRTVLAGTILWRQGGAPTDGIYLVEDGTLRSVQEFQDSGAIRRSVEVVLPGTISGELGLFTGNNRMSTVVSETDGILWGLSQERFQKMVKDDPTLAVEFMRVAMSYSAGTFCFLWLIICSNVPHFMQGCMINNLPFLFLILSLSFNRAPQHDDCLCLQP